MKVVQRFWQKRAVRFLFGGGVAAAFNLLLMFLFIEVAGWDTTVLRNAANIISIELSLLFSFVIYRIWVWRGGTWRWREVLLRQLPLYHLSAGASVVLRVFAIFPLLDWLEVSYGVNTLVGVLVSAVFNYIVSDRLVFRDRRSENAQLYRPEGLEAAFPDSKKTHEGTEEGVHAPVSLFSIVIPAYNEEGSITETVTAITERLERHQVPYEIVVVNDNSRDRTETVLQQLSQENPRVRYVNNYYPNGFGFALRCGLEQFNGDAVAIVMADASDSPEDILTYYHLLQEGYDCVFGSRFVRGGEVIDYPRHKLVVNRLANLFIQVLFGLGYNDSTNAFKAYRREVIEGIHPILSHHFNLTVELPLKSIVRGYSYVTTPIRWQNRKAGVSKLKIKEMGSRYLFIVLYVLLERWLSRGDYRRQATARVVTPTPAEAISSGKQTP
ncbi:glycosyltransferase [Sodalinema gerasimenkoae]|uniref:glycosyltransferase n=1 Tax=Sodalinema gerasimenkoae TaxID=2862348 RepID=UPI00135C34D9|nr:glycosyltransferase [Sodalinema gerasimenkoae]